MQRGQLGLFTSRVRKPPPAPEFHLHCMVADVLTRWGAPEWQFTHIANGEYRPPATAARLKRMGLRSGWPDFILLSPDGTPRFLELKRRGGQLSDAQLRFGEWCHGHRVAFAWADNFDDAVLQLKNWGAVKTVIAT